MINKDREKQKIDAFATYISVFLIYSLNVEVTLSIYQLDTNNLLS